MFSAVKYTDETVYFSDTYVIFYQTKRRHDQEGTQPSLSPPLKGNVNLFQFYVSISLLMSLLVTSEM
jgi:hypothetical protein